MQRALAGSKSQLAPSFFTTSTYAPADQFEAWRDFNADIIDLSPSGQERISSFRVDHWSWNFGDLVLERTRLPGRVEREWHHRARSHIDHWCIVLARGGSEDQAATPNISVRSLTRPFTGRGRDTEVICLFVPRSRLVPHLARHESQPDVDLSPGCKALLMAHLESLTDQIDSLPAATRTQIADATCALVQACLVHSPGRAVEVERPIFSALHERARRIVRANMAAPDFGPAALTRLLFVSRSKLYRIFESDGGVARFIQRERLAEAYRRLTEDTSAPSISALALEVGFRDHSAFSRAFRTEFDVSPREARERALANAFVEGVIPAPDEAPGRVTGDAPGGRTGGETAAVCGTRLSIRGESWKDGR